MALIVQKYGGSSLATPRHMRAAARRIRELKAKGHDLVVVVSAMGRMTDHLIRLAERTVKRPPQRELDMLMTAGERISMALLAMALHEEGVPAISFTGSQTGILTTDDHTEARIVDIRAHRTQEELSRGKVVIIAGFQGVSSRKEVTTLGRGGSDTTAVALAAALGAERCEILTDVDGLFSADPRLVPTARLLPVCSYDEALELASLGAKMQPRSIEVAKRYRVHVWIASSQRVDSPGTELTDRAGALSSGSGGEMEATLIRGIATRDGYHFFEVKTTLEALVDIASRERIVLRCFSFVDGVGRFLCEKEKSAALIDALKQGGISFREVSRIATVSAVGDGLSASPDLLPRFLEALRRVNVDTLIVTANSLSVTAAIVSDHREVATRSLHQGLIEAAPVSKAPSSSAGAPVLNA